MRIEAYIQARMGSTRLPGKVLKKVLNKPLLEFLVERLSQCKEIDAIVILTTNQTADDCIASFCKERNIAFFRGSENDVLQRYYQAATQRKTDVIVRITADCPLIDPEVVDQVVRLFLKEDPRQLNYVSNTLERTFPRGLDVEVFSLSTLQEASKNAVEPAEREHVTLYMYRNPARFRLKNLIHSPSLGLHRWTVDTPEDFTLIKLILENLYPVNPDFRLADILNLLASHPEWSALNAHIIQEVC